MTTIRKRSWGRPPGVRYQRYELATMVSERLSA
jgi:hypothetical protein